MRLPGPIIHSWCLGSSVERWLLKMPSALCAEIMVKSLLTIRDEACNDASFRDRELTLLETLNFGMVSQFASDPMHLLDEGVMARMLQSIFFNRTCAV